MTLPGLPGRKFSAKVIRTAGAITAPDSRTLPVEIEMDNPKEEFLAGSYAKVRFIEAKMKAALTLPANTVFFRAEGPRVGIVQPDGKVSLRTVFLGRDFGQTIEILAGVEFPSDRVIVNPSDSLATGTVVSVVQADEKGEEPMKMIQQPPGLVAKTRRIVAFSALIVMLIAMVVSGCAVGPNYQRPEATTIPTAYTGVSDEWKIAVPQAHLPKGNWWEIFGDPELSRLEAGAAGANQDLKAAYARFQQARAIADVAQSGFFPAWAPPFSR